MKIAHINFPVQIPPKGYGGAERMIFNLAKTQAKHGHQVTIFAGPNSHIPGCETKSFVKGYDVGTSWIKQRKEVFEHVRKSYSYIGKDYDIIHNHIQEEGVSLSFLAKSPVVTTIHGQGQAHNNFLPRLITKIFSLTGKTKYLAISSNLYERNKNFLKNNLIGFVYSSAINPEDYSFYEIPKKNHDIELRFLSLITEHKGTHIAIDLAEKLHNDGKDVYLKIGGKVTNFQDNYIKKITCMIKNKPYIEFKPNLPTSEIPDFIGNSDAFLFPILWDEPYGLVIVESFSFGTPVIAFSRGSIPELIKNGKTGYVCKNIEEFYSSILSINKIKRIDCRNFIETEHNNEKMYQDYLKFYIGLVETN